MIRINDERFLQFPEVDPATNRALHVRLCPSRITSGSSIPLSELDERDHVVDDDFLVDSGKLLKAALHRHVLQFQYKRHEIRNSVERVFREG